MTSHVGNPRPLSALILISRFLCHPLFISCTHPFSDKLGHLNLLHMLLQTNKIHVCFLTGVC